MWIQNYDPFGNPVLSTLVAAIPIVVLLGGIGLFGLKAHIAALLGILSSLIVAIFAFDMPAGMASAAAAYGAAYGLLPIGWIILNVIFLYRLTSERGDFRILQQSIASITPDRRLQLLLIAFGFGAFFEGAAGFGTPVAVTGAMLIGLGFSPLAASGLSLIANTAPVAFGALGTPIVALSSVTGLDLHELSGMVGRQLPFFSVIVPFWLICAFAGWRGMIQIWPAILVSGVSFAVPQYLVSNFHGPWLVDIVSAALSIGALTLFLRVWQPRTLWLGTDGKEHADPAAATQEQERVSYARRDLIRAWTPWLFLTICVFLWGIPQVKAALDNVFALRFPVAGLHDLVFKAPPVAIETAPEAAIYSLNILSATGTGILLASLLTALFLKFSLREFFVAYGRTIVVVRHSLLTIAAMLALGYVTRYSGADATMGLAFANTGWLYPLFGTMLGWLGVALTGSDTASNVLFGGLQKVTSQQLGIDPVLMSAANSSGGVMGKMIDAQSIVVASTATRWYGHEKLILRYVFFHSVALAVLVGLLVLGQAYVWPLTALVHR
jgi:lactate permease